MTDADLLTALRDCYDPVQRRNIVDLNLIRTATLTPDPASLPAFPRFIASIILTAPTADEAANTQLTAQIENRLLGIESISCTNITLLPPLFAIL